MTSRHTGLRADDAVASHRAGDEAGPSIEGARTYAHGTSAGATAAVSCVWSADQTGPNARNCGRPRLCGALGATRPRPPTAPGGAYHLVAVDRLSGTQLQDHVCSDFYLHSSTAILSEKYRISSELRSQATAGPVSTTVGDHVGIRGAVGSLFCFLPPFCLVPRSRAAPARAAFIVLALGLRCRAGQHCAFAAPLFPPPRPARQRRRDANGERAKATSPKRNFRTVQLRHSRVHSGTATLTTIAGTHALRGGARTLPLDAATIARRRHGADLIERA